MSKRAGNNEGSIRQRKDGLWEARYIERYDESGKPVRKSIYSKERSEVFNKLNEILNQKQKGTYIIHSKMKFSEWADNWFNNYAMPNLREGTLSGYNDIINNHLNPNIGDKVLQELDVDDIQKMIAKISKQIPHKSKLQISRLEKKIEKVSASLALNKKRYSKSDLTSLVKNLEELKTHRISSGTIHNIITLLSTILNQAQAKGLISKNVAKLSVKPKVEREDIEVLSLEEQMELKKVLGTHRLGFAFELILATGLRQAELMGLRLIDVDLAKGVIKVRQQLQRRKDMSHSEKKSRIVIGKLKTAASRRDVHLPSPIIKKFEMFLEKRENEKTFASSAWEESGLVFVTEIGKNIQPRNLLEIFHALLKKADLPIRGLHSLRHTYATRCIESGMDPKTLCELLGHEDITTTLNLYVHPTDDAKRNAVQGISNLFD